MNYISIVFIAIYASFVCATTNQEPDVIYIDDKPVGNIKEMIGGSRVRRRQLDKISDAANFESKIKMASDKVLGIFLKKPLDKEELKQQGLCPNKNDDIYELVRSMANNNIKKFPKLCKSYTPFNFIDFKDARIVMSDIEQGELLICDKEHNESCELKNTYTTSIRHGWSASVTAGLETEAGFFVAKVKASVSATAGYEGDSTVTESKEILYKIPPGKSCSPISGYLELHYNYDAYEGANVLLDTISPTWAKKDYNLEACRNDKTKFWSGLFDKRTSTDNPYCKNADKSPVSTNPRIILGVQEGFEYVKIKPAKSVNTKVAFKNSQGKLLKFNTCLFY